MQNACVCITCGRHIQPAMDVFRPCNMQPEFCFIKKKMYWLYTFKHYDCNTSLWMLTILRPYLIFYFQKCKLNSNSILINSNNNLVVLSSLIPFGWFFCNLVKKKNSTSTSFEIVQNLLEIYSSHPFTQDVDEFVFSSKIIWENVALHHLLTNGSSTVNGCRQNESPNSW